MINTQELRRTESTIFSAPTQPLEKEADLRKRAAPKNAGHIGLLGQALRFGLVGALNTVVDLLILNGLLWLFPARSILLVLAFSAFAYSFGALNSFLLNKFWTFGHRQRTTRQEVARFALTTLCGIAWSTGILWLAGNALRPLLGNSTLWANASKIIAIGGTAFISYLGMRLWVFVSGRR